MKAWRESASLILAARHGQKYARTSSANFQYNYNLLCLKRHEKSKFMPGTYVFPGGAIDPSDADLKWRNLFSAFGFDNNSFSSLYPNAGISRPNIFKARPNELPREISLRITAIRETFEECGVLMCKKIREDVALSGWAQHVAIPVNELHSWQTKVHNDANEFYSLCENLKCYPDLWSLHEWSNWLTPTYFPGSLFDTVFYLACLPHMPPAVHEELEIEELKWDEPGNLSSFPANAMLPPPQQYEIARLGKFENLDNLLDFALERSKKGVQSILPVKIQVRDGPVHVFPGDSMYPKEPSLTEKQVIDRTDITMQELRDLSPVKNRMEFFNLAVKDILVENFESPDGHLSPVQLQNVNKRENDPWKNNMSIGRTSSL